MPSFPVGTPTVKQSFYHMERKPVDVPDWVEGLFLTQNRALVQNTDAENVVYYGELSHSK